MSPSTAYRRFPVAMAAPRSGMGRIRPREPRKGQSQRPPGPPKLFRLEIDSRPRGLRGELQSGWAEKGKRSAHRPADREEYRRFCGTENQDQAPRGDEELDLAL